MPTPDLVAAARDFISRSHTDKTGNRGGPMTKRASLTEQLADEVERLRRENLRLLESAEEEHLVLLKEREEIQSLRVAVAVERERTLFVYRYVRDRLESPSALYELTLLFGDAPADCGCREAACPHERQFPPSETEIIETIDAAIRRGEEGEDADT